MKDYRDRIGSHAQFDHHSYWRFERDSKIPHGTFGGGWNVDGIVCIACVILLVVGILAINIGS